MPYILAFAAVLSAWCFSLILSGERQRQLNEAHSSQLAAGKSLAKSGVGKNKN